MITECATPEATARIEQVLADLLQCPVSLRFEQAMSGEGEASPQATSARRRGDLDSDPMVRKVVELFEARPLHLEYDEESN